LYRKAGIGQRKNNSPSLQFTAPEAEHTRRRQKAILLFSFHTEHFSSGVTTYYLKTNQELFAMSCTTPSTQIF
jgi:hypothetical protein